MTPTATRLKLRLDERYSWLRNEWFFAWHHIGGDKVVAIDQFDGRKGHYSHIEFGDTARIVYWDSIARFVRKEVIEQFGWVEEAVRVYDRETALQTIDDCAGQLTGFARKVRRTAIDKDRILRGNGREFPAPSDEGYWDGSTDHDIAAQARALKKALFPPLKAPEVSTKDAKMTPDPSATLPYHVALSFAGEQRDYVRAVAEELRTKNVTVFFDEFEQVALWGKDGAEHFHQIFSRDASYVVMFLSKEYVAKSWTTHERRSAISRQLDERREYILPVRFDDCEVPGLPSTTQYLVADRHTPVELAQMVVAKISGSPPSN